MDSFDVLHMLEHFFGWEEEKQKHRLSSIRFTHELAFTSQWNNLENESESS